MTTRCIQSPGFRRRRLIYAHATGTAAAKGKAPGPRPTTRLPPRAEPAPARRMAPAAALPGPRRGPDSDTRRTAHAGRKPAPGPKRGRRGGPVSFHIRPGVPAASRTGRRVTRGRAATSGGTPPGRGAAARAPSRWRGARAGKRATRHTANRAERYEASPDLPLFTSGTYVVVVG